MTEKAQVFDDERRREKDFLYSVLNLPVFATEADIKERHRALSLIFHPDKQRDENLKEHAKERFLEVQAAYEILSDPFLREVYDTLGYDGLRLNFPPHLRHLPQDEIRPALRTFLYEHESQQLSAKVNSRATLSCLLDVRKLLRGSLLPGDWYNDLSERLSETRLSILALRHTFVRRIGPQTKLLVISKLGQPDQDEFDTVPDFQRFNLIRGNVLGVLSHQYSPSKQLQVKASLLRLHRGATVSLSHEDKLNFARISAPIRPTLAPPPLSFTLRRRLFPNSLTLGTFECTVARGVTPTVSIGLIKPTVSFSPRSKSGSASQRRQEWIASGWAMGLNLRLPSGPSVYAQWQALSQPLQTTGKLGLEYGLLTGLGGTIEGSWTSDEGETEVTSTVSWDFRGVIFRLSVAYLGQRLELPITLADNFSPRLVLASTVIPAATFAIVDYVILQSRRTARGKKRLEDYERSRRERAYEGRAEAEAVSTMLSDVARRSVQAEKNSDGLVILEASYVPVDDTGILMPEFGIDVTVPLQALVHKSQLYIPGGRSKNALRGFYDPLPECDKRLGVRYYFRGRMHYAEVDEKAPLLMPLESHLTGSVDVKSVIKHT